MSILSRFSDFCFSIKQWFLKALFPEFCILCNREGTLLCQNHQKNFPAHYQTLRLKHIDGIQVLHSYQHEPVKKTIHALKYDGLSDIAEYIADEYRLHVKEGYTLIAIPLHWKRQLKRGYNQNEKIIQALKRKNNLILSDKNLKRIRNTETQTHKTKKERFKNIKNAFQWRGKNPPPQKIILIDDVITTGATIEEAARTLKKAGAQEIRSIIFAQSKKEKIEVFEKNT